MGRTYRFSHPTSYPSRGESLKKCSRYEFILFLGPTDISEFVDKSEHKILIIKEFKSGWLYKVEKRRFRNTEASRPNVIRKIKSRHMAGFDLFRK